jgi:hypothetical protein
MMSTEQLKGLKKEVKSEVTKDLINKNNDHNWTPQWSEKLIQKAKKNEYINLIELRQENIIREPKAKDLPGGNGEIQWIVKDDKGKKELTSIVEWASLYHNYIDLLESVGNKWGLHQAVKNGRFCHGLISKDRHTWPSIIDYDSARRKAAQPGEPWNYDAAIACSTLVFYNKDEAKNNGKKRGRAGAGAR